MPQIRVHEKALAHLSRGLYRSPASALRELVSNAWDANATTVFISTNYPHFAQLVVQDNGDGFNRAEFERLMAGGIGNSDKRQLQKRLINDRPLIGRLGIGLLGIAQICGSFEISSWPKDGEAFRARVRLYDLIRERLDTDDPEIVKDDSLALGIREVDVGDYEFLLLDPGDRTRGTQITSTEIHPTFIRSFCESMQTAPKFQPPPLDWSKCLDIISNVHTLHELGDYWKLLWELSAACPIPYVSANAVPRGAIKDIHKRLVSYDFTLRVDGITLAKPVLLRGNKGGYTVEKIPRRAQQVYGKKLEFEGCLVVQEGLQLKPDELRGLLIRIKNVGVGYYDPSFLDYPFNEGPRAKWVTGEVFVDRGLEDALNVDRDSFNRFHPEFRALQQYVHDLLRKSVFPEVYKNISNRSAARESERQATRVSVLQELLSTSLDAKVRVRNVPLESVAVAVESIDDKVQIAFGDLSRLRTRKNQRQLAASILALYDVAAREHGSEQKRRRFEQLLLALLSRW
jgi:hypothetical protein